MKLKDIKNMTIGELGDKIKEFGSNVKNKINDGIDNMPLSKKDIKNVKDKTLKSMEKFKCFDSIIGNIKPITQEHFSTLLTNIEKELKDSFTMYVDGRTDAINITFKEFQDAWEIILSCMEINFVSEWNKKIDEINSKRIFGLPDPLSLKKEVVNKKESLRKSKQNNNLISGWLSYKKTKTLNKLVINIIKNNLEDFKF